MSSVDGQAFLGGDDNNKDDDFAALDSMSYSGIMSPSTGFANLTSSSPAVPSSSSGSLGTGGSAMGDGRENGFPGVSGSLFDRIRARTEAEQQSRKQQKDNVGAQQYNQLPPQSQVSSGQSSQEQQQQQQQQSAFVSQQNQQQPPSAFMSHHPRSQVDDYSFNNNNETTYAANNSGGENFSNHNIMAPVHAPTYQNRSNDPYNAAYAAMGGGGNERQNNMSSALARASDAAKSIFGAGIGGVVSVGTLAKDKIVAGFAGTGRGGGGGGGGGRSYTNSFLLREDSIEGGMQGFGGGGGGDIGQQQHQQHPPPIGEISTGGGGGASDQAYSMIRYGKTFVEDVYLFVQQLPTWGKGVLGVFVLIGLWLLFG